MAKQWIDINDEVVVVTGGCSGIGSHIVSDLLNNGAKVIIYDLKPDDLYKDNDNVLTVKGSVTEPKEIQNMVDKALEKFGRIDALVNDAGVTRVKMLVDYYHENPEHEYNADDFDFVLGVNAKGAMLTAQAVAKVMVKQQKGVIVNITSEAGMEGSKGQSIYSASKGALNSFTLSWAKELGQHNIRVVGVAPGINEPTPMGAGTHMDDLAYTRGITKDQIGTDYQKVIPLGRQGRLDEIADLVTYLVSDHASYITGTTVNVTGGKSRG